MRAALRVRLAAEPLAVPAVDARAEPRAVRIRVRARRVGRTAAETGGSPPATPRRRRGPARSSARAAAADSRGRAAASKTLPPCCFCAAEVARLAAHAGRPLELVVVRLELLVRHRPVLHRHVCRDERLAVPLLVMRAERVIDPRPSPRHAVPVHAGAAESFARQKRSELAHRQRASRTGGCGTSACRAPGSASARCARRISARRESAAWRSPGLVARMPPRSSATTFMPASLSSFARMPPVHPSPTMTTSTSFRRVGMASLRTDRRCSSARRRTSCCGTS